MRVQGCLEMSLGAESLRYLSHASLSSLILAGRAGQERSRSAACAEGRTRVAGEA